MSDRDQILSSIHEKRVRGRKQRKDSLFKKIKEEELLSKWQEIEMRRASRIDELVKTFKIECEILPAKVYLAETTDEACHIISSIITEVGAGKIIKWNSPVFKKMQIESYLAALGDQDKHLIFNNLDNDIKKNDSKKIAREAEIGISGADYALADTGTIVMRTGSGKEKITSLLPPTHIAILEAQHILPDLDDLISRLALDFERNRRLDSCITLITGPSKTADIEMDMVYGVHGPQNLHVVILE